MNLEPNISQEEFERIERYLLNEMSAGEISTFETELNQQPALRELVEEHRLLLIGIKEAGLTEKLNEFHQEIFENNTGTQVSSEETGSKILKTYSSTRSTVRKFIVRSWLVAASLILLAGIGIWWFFNTQNNYSKIFADYYSPDPGLITAMGVSDNYEFERAMVNYKRGEYTEALKSWDKLLASNSSSDTLNYFIGSAHLAGKNAEKAIEYFEKVVADNSSAFRNDALWYLGLANLKMGRIKEAKSFIESSDHEDKQDLLSLLKD
ncbi:MAG TPA: tetratricopeptide repeat protein [Parasegetibacter sp.]